MRTQRQRAPPKRGATTGLAIAALVCVGLFALFAVLYDPPPIPDTPPPTTAYRRLDKAAIVAWIHRPVVVFATMAARGTRTVSWVAASAFAVIAPAIAVGTLTSFSAAGESAVIVVVVIALVRAALAGRGFVVLGPIARLGVALVAALPFALAGYATAGSRFPIGSVIAFVVSVALLAVSYAAVGARAGVTVAAHNDTFACMFESVARTTLAFVVIDVVTAPPDVGGYAVEYEPWTLQLPILLAGVGAALLLPLSTPR